MTQDSNNLISFLGYLVINILIIRNKLTKFTQHVNDEVYTMQLIRSNHEARKRMVKSYELMLDFYGMTLIDEKTGHLQLANNWRKRQENMNKLNS